MATSVAGWIGGWLAGVSGQIASISLPILLLALALHALESFGNALAWRNILRAAYPASSIRLRSVVGAYAGGIGLNGILPAQAGTVAMLGLFRVQIADSTTLGMVGAGGVQNLFYAVVGAALCIVLVVSRPASFDVQVGLLHAPALAALVATAIVALVVILLCRRYLRRWRDAAEGAAILAHPRQYVTQVLSLQAACYAARVGVGACFMSAYGVPLSPETLTLVIAANSISSTFAVTPGGVGAQQALASMALRHVAAANVVTAYSLGQQLILTAWDFAVGLVLLWWTIGLAATRRVHTRARDGERRLLGLQAARRRTQNPIE